MTLRKIISLLLILVISVWLLPIDTFALSTGVVGTENYPGKMDTRNVNWLWKNISNDFFGWAMTFRYPFVFPAGSRGLTPSLELSYSSNNTDAFSPYGYGFSLSLPRIQRSAKKWVSELYIGDEFVSGGQDLIREVWSMSQYRSKDATDMSLYTRTASGGWIQYLSDGKMRILGNTPSSRIADPADPTHIYAWLIDEERDQFWHAIRYRYTIDGGQPYLAVIEYGFHTSWSDPLYTIGFDYIAKTASLTSYRTQFEVSTRKLLSKVVLSVAGTPTRWYDLTYDTVDAPISHLISLTESAPGGLSLPSTTFSYGQAQYQHMITGIDNHRGGKAIFEYAPSTGYRNGSGTLQNNTLPFVVQTLSKQVLIDQVTGITATESYSYGSGNYYYDTTDIWGREYVGFARVGIRDNTTDKTLYFHQSQTADPDPLKYQDHIAKKWRLYRSDIRDIVSGKILSRELTRYDMKTLGARWLVYPLYQISSRFDTDGSHSDTAVSSVVDDMGNILRQTQYGWVNANLDDATFVDIPGDTVTIDRTYLSNTSKNLYGFLSTEQITWFSWSLMSMSQIEYDGTSSGIILGLPTAKIQIDTVTGDVVRDMIQYSSRGLPIEKTDPLGNKTTLVYDDRDIALQTETNPLWWSIAYTYDYAAGKPTTIKNQNDIISKSTFDTWWREASRSRIVDGAETLLMTRSYDDTTIPNNSLETSYFTAWWDSKTNRGYMDGWGRTIMTATSTEKPGQYSISQVRYDENGNPIYAGYPVFASTETWDVGLVLSGVTDGERYRMISPGVSYRYDALGRIVSQRDARGTTTKSYIPRSETITDALGIATRNTRDAYDNIITVEEDATNTDITTRYSYDALKRPIWLQDALANIRNWTYDGLGRLHTATDTHSTWDSTYGVRWYQYDPLGRLVEYTTAKWVKVNYSYDPLSRLIRETYPTTGSGVWSRDYTYDQGSRSLGTLSRVQDTDSTVSYTYDPLGRKTREIRTIGDHNYTIGYGYNTASLLTRITYPDGWQTDYLYAHGYIEWVDYTDPTGVLSHLVTDISYAPNSTMQSLRYGNGVVKNTTRDPDHNYRLTRSTSTLSGSTLLDTEYRYDAVSGIDQIRENGIEPLRKSVDYTYDPLSRLTRADYSYMVQGYNRTNNTYSYIYDDIGNIMSASAIGSYGYSGIGYASPHAVTTAGDTSYAYDEAGQTISRTSPGMILSFAYSPYGEMTTSVKNGDPTTYTYDHTRRRITKSTLGLIEHHIIDGYEVEYESGALVVYNSTNNTSVTNTGDNSQWATGSTTNTGTTNTGTTSTGTENPLDQGGSWSIAEVGGLGSWQTSSGSSSTDSGIIQSGSLDLQSAPPDPSLSTTGSTSQDGATGSGETMAVTGSSDTSESTHTGTTESTVTSTGSSIHTGSVTNTGSDYTIVTGEVAASLPPSPTTTLITLRTTLTHIMLGDERIATFQTQTDDTPKTPDDDTLVYHLSDHLNSSSLDLSSTWLLLQAVDYQPFGKSITYEVSNKRIKWKKWGYVNKYKFANKQEDQESDLQYFEKRYYDNRIWRFTTEDPVYWEVGLTKRPNTYFTDPQQWNSYSYVRNNPINLVDPTGESSNPWQQFMDTLWQLYDAGATNIGNDVKSEAKAYQQVATTIAQNAPWTWDVWDAYALATGKDLYSGEDVSGWNRALTAAAIFIPWVSGGEMRAGKSVFAWIASKIANWHAFEKHIWEFKDLWIKTKDQLSKFAEWIMKNANNTNNMRNLENGRKAYFDNKTNTIVITNPNAKDAWTIFRPSTWKDYFLNTKNLK